MDIHPSQASLYILFQRPGQSREGHFKSCPVYCLHSESRHRNHDLIVTQYAVQFAGRQDLTAGAEAGAGFCHSAGAADNSAGDEQPTGMTLAAV